MGWREGGGEGGGGGGGGCIFTVDYFRPSGRGRKYISSAVSDIQFCGRYSRYPSRQVRVIEPRDWAHPSLRWIQIPDWLPRSSPRCPTRCSGRCCIFPKHSSLGLTINSIFLLRCSSYSLIQPRFQPDSSQIQARFKPDSSQIQARSIIHGLEFEAELMSY